MNTSALREIEATIVNALARHMRAPVAAAVHFRHIYLSALVLGETPIVPLSGLPFRVRTDSHEYSEAMSEEERSLLRRRDEVTAELSALEERMAAVKHVLSSINRSLEAVRDQNELIHPYENSDDAQLVEAGLLVLVGKPSKAGANGEARIQRAELTAKGQQLAQQFLDAEERSKRARGVDFKAALRCKIRTACNGVS